MATINYLPSFPISDRVFPCPRKHMLIYGQKPSSPPPATLTQEQLARDAGQLVEAHVLLDRLCDDTDRSQHSLVHRIRQVVYGSEEMNKVLEKAGFNTAAGLLECVRALAQRQKTTKETLDQVEARALGYQLEITRLKDRNKRLHDAQGSGTAEAAKLQKVRDTLSKLTGPTARGVVGMAEDVVTMNLTQRGEIVRLRAEAGKDSSLERMVQQAHRRLHRAEVSPLSGTILERVEALIAERDQLKVFTQLKDKVQAAHRKLNTVEQVCTFGTIDERVTSLVDLFKARVASVVPNGVPLEDVQCHLKLNELLEIERTGTLLERVTQAVAVVKDYGQKLDTCRIHLTQACRTLGVPNPANMTVEGMAMAVNERVGIWEALHADVHRMFDKAGIPSGTLDERVRVAIERGQQAKVAPDAAHCVNVVEECVRKLNEANVICVPLPDRIQHLLDERAAVRRDLLNLAAVTATADSNRTLAVRAVNRVTTMEKTIVAFANSPSVKELL